MASGRINVEKDLKPTNPIVRTEQIRHLPGPETIPVSLDLGRRRSKELWSSYAQRLIIVLEYHTIKYTSKY
jgi:hypothetical protein